MSDQAVVLPDGSTATPAPPETEPTPSPTPASPSEPAPSPPGEEAPKEESGSLLSEAKEAPPPFDPDKLTLPEGIDKDSPLIAEFKDLAKEAGVSAPAAQKLMELHAKYASTANEKIQQAWTAQNEEWQKQVREDKEIGGDKLQGHLQTFATVAGDPSLTDPEFRQALLFTGAGNHPAIVKTLVKWAAALSEGGSVSGGAPARNGQGQLVNAPRSLGDALYPGGYSSDIRGNR